MISVHFQPGDVTVEVEPGTTILAAAEKAGVVITAPCGGRGRCGRCRVVVDEGCDEPTGQERALLGDRELADGVRLACEATLRDDATVRVPSGSRTVSGKILSEDAWKHLALHPNVHVDHLDLPEPSLQDQRSDLQRVAEGLGLAADDLPAHEAALTELPVALREGDFSVTTVRVGNRLARVLPAGRDPQALGVAVDIGTTTVVAYLVDLQTGARLATTSAMNPQARYGHDLISRIEHVQSSPTGMADMRGAIVELVNDLISQACEEAGASMEDVYEATVVGNTCMHHLFLGLEPRYLAEAPYIPIVSRPVELDADDAGLAINRAGSVYCLPIIAGFVGADTVAVLLVSEITSRDHPTLAIDIGTNGEVMLWSGERLLVTSCAAGPAFEGGEISRGVRAAEGAVERIWLRNGDLDYATIGGAPANGICGSGIFDIVAVLLDTGVADTMGRFIDDDAAAHLPPAVAARLRGDGPTREFIIVPGGDGQQELTFTQKDMREVQLAKGAVRAAVELLCAEAGIEVSEIEEILLAGAFGNYIDRRSALRMGLLPEVELERIVGIGNAAGAGALAALVSVAQRRRAVELARTAEHLELMASASFQMVFADSMIFPDRQESGVNSSASGA